MTQLLEKNVYLNLFEEFASELPENDALAHLRRNAIARFEKLGFPGPRNEDWKYTNLSPLSRLTFQRAALDGDESRARAFYQQTAGSRPGLLFENGYVRDISAAKPELPDGVQLRSLSKQPDGPFGKIAKFDDNALTALNTAFLSDGAFLQVADNQVVEQPIFLVHVAAPADQPTVSFPRNLIVCGKNSQVTIVEAYLGPEGQTYFTNAVTEIVVGEDAVVEHCKLQREGPDAYHVANTQVLMRRGSRFASQYISLGGKLVRNESRVLFEGERAEATLNGLYLGGGTQHIDNFTLIDHAKPNCTSHELYKGILNDKAQGVFNGKIFVRQDAQKTDAKQTNKVLLLSEDATINTKPQLEIFADDVKCTHGATVGQLDAESIFYLRSRGIGEAEARGLLTFAFANDIISRIKVESIRAQLEQLLTGRHLSQSPAAEGAS